MNTASYIGPLSDLHPHDLPIIFIYLPFPPSLDGCLGLSSIILLPFSATVLILLTVSNMDFYFHVLSSVSIFSNCKFSFFMFVTYDFWNLVYRGFILFLIEDAEHFP